ncbi:hypothetical protein GCM10010302_42370 [Streptomyces polychromogenes]|uniref:Uncharacterized protein n=1 Tax=Streptomyces polychromogenes TaxID=67342 RepID=A0ABN0VH06_9ACTN
MFLPVYRYAEATRDGTAPHPTATRMFPPPGRVFRHGWALFQRAGYPADPELASRHVAGGRSGDQL